jgi:hypothetical protein
VYLAVIPFYSSDLISDAMIVLVSDIVNDENISEVSYPKLLESVIEREKPIEYGLNDNGVRIALLIFIVTI